MMIRFFAAGIFCALLFVGCDMSTEPDGPEGNWRNGSWADGDVITYRAAQKAKPVNIVITGNGFTAADLQADGAYVRAATALAQAFTEAPVIRDYLRYFNVYIYAAQSEVDSFKENNLKGTPFKPDGGNSPHPSRDIIHERLKKAVPDIDAQGGIGDGYFVMCINNLRDCQWDWYAGVATGDRRVIGPSLAATLDAKQFVFHELVGHGFAGLDEEYAGSGNKTAWGTDTPNTNGHGFPAYGTTSSLTPYKLSEVRWPDAPGGPMAWANAIFGDEKGDGFLALPQEIINKYHLEKYFSHNSKVRPKIEAREFDYDPFTAGNQTEPVWLSPGEDKSSAWTATHNPGGVDWRLWPGWVAFIGRTGYTYTTSNDWLRPAPWLNKLGDKDFNYQSDDACTMRQSAAFFCPICRYRIWVKIQNEFDADGYGKDASYWMSFPEDGKFANKFPSEFGLQRFVGRNYYNDRARNKTFAEISK